MSDANVVRLPKRDRRHRAVKHQLLTRKSLDLRSNAAKEFDRLVGAITADPGGAENLSTIQLRLVEAFAGQYSLLQGQHFKLLLRQPVDMWAAGLTATSLVRLCNRLGVQRSKPKHEGLSLGQILRQGMHHG